eukprot:TRINITY_DN20280_c0_g1_i2.p1 TRINITY_DN20280_c0_g1~~TRINITY_DN20280_c0_g1_i2.p1  ORF type:complete len:168 (-),score=19.64 TRINITY_DN20280_c0_g1_i2:70-573(-)
MLVDHYLYEAVSLASLSAALFLSLRSLSLAAALSFSLRSLSPSPVEGLAADQLGLRGSASKSRDSPPQSVPSSSTVNAAGPGKPLRLVYCDERGKFHMDPEAVATLQLVKGPIDVVSVCCRACQGKSYILNQVLVDFLPFHIFKGSISLSCLDIGIHSMEMEWCSWV